MKGYPEGDFRPLNNINRIDAIKMIVASTSNSIKNIDSDSPYNDTSSTKWYHQYLVYATTNGNPNISGVPFDAKEAKISFFFSEDNKLYPNMEVTRAEAAHMLANALKLKVRSVSDYKSDGSLMKKFPFPDLDSSNPDHHYRWVMACVKAGIINGYKDGTFKPKKLLSRSEMSKLTYKIMTF